MTVRAAFVAAALAVAASLYPAPGAVASDVVVVRSEGTSTRTKDAGEAKTVAVEMALKGAVREAALGLGDMAPGVLGVPGGDEGYLTKMRSKIVSRKHLKKVYQKYHPRA